MNDKPVGAPPHPKPWPDDEKHDKDLLLRGDRRNVDDRYRYQTVEAIKAELDSKRTGLEVAIENWQYDFNIGTIVRNANAFNVSKVHIIGKRHWNRRGAMVTDRYLHIDHHATVAEFIKAVDGLTVVAFDNTAGATPLAGTKLPKNCVLVFGGEGPGISEEMLAASHQLVEIEQLGSTRSINVGVTSGIAMYDWTKRHILKSLA